MSTITAIFEANAGGSLRLPVPEELRHCKIQVTATLLPLEPGVETKKGFGALEGKISMSADFDEPLELSVAEPKVFSATPEMLEKRKKAFERLRELNPFRDIDDPTIWQHEIRTDRPLLGGD